MEWWGVYRPSRAIIRAAFRRQERGRAVVLVASVRGEVVGQAWVELPRREGEPGYIWAVRVFPCLQRQGIGTRLMAEAETELLRRGIGVAELSVERGNARALRLYRRLGYRVVGAAPRRRSCGRGGRAGAGRTRQWVLRKALGVGRWRGGRSGSGGRSEM